MSAWGGRYSGPIAPAAASAHELSILPPLLSLVIFRGPERPRNHTVLGERAQSSELPSLCPPRLHTAPAFFTPPLGKGRRHGGWDDARASGERRAPHSPNWLRGTGSNRRPPGYESGELPLLYPAKTKTPQDRSSGVSVNESPVS